jgi:type I thyroxine 5'-deiodinase
LPVNRAQQVVYAQPTSGEERAAVAEACVLRLNLAMPMLLDSMGDEIDALYIAWPERLYVLDPAGMVAYRSDPGPWGFDVAAWEQAIQLQLP